MTTSKLSPRVYISGPLSRGPLDENLNAATAAFVALVRAGFAPLCLHWSVYSKRCVRVDDSVVACVGTRQGNEELSHSDWRRVDLPWVAVSDAVLRLPGESVGSDRETAFARECGIPVFESVQAVIDHFA